MDNKPALVLIPGLLNTAELFHHQVAALAKRADIIIPDHTTHNEMGPLAAAMLAILPERFILAGVSMGGYIALEIMRRAPERVQSLVLCDTTARPDGAEHIAERERLITLAEDGRYGEVKRIILPRYVSEENFGNREIVRLLERMTDSIGVEGFVRQERAVISRPDSRPHLGDIACPTTVVMGEQDAIFGHDIHREIVDGISGAELIVIPGSGHLPPIETPERMTAILARVLDDHSCHRPPPDRR